DGRVGLAVVVGTLPEATDVAPDVGGLSTGTGTAAASDRRERPAGQSEIQGCNWRSFSMYFSKKNRWMSCMSISRPSM
ncbi:MAG TPA: hypothetical protein VLL48_07590, partial [Longimicrobiales bacterium]|nr:hypothetical protein [Longimicrobiales bacterium]